MPAPSWLSLLSPLPPDAVAQRKPVASAAQLEEGTAGPIAGWQSVTVNFLAEITSGTLGVSNETTDVGFFSLSAMAELDIIDPHMERIDDFFAGQEAAFFR